MKEELTLEPIAYSVGVTPNVEYKHVLAAPRGTMDYVKRSLYLQILMPRSEDRTRPESLHPIVVYPMGGGWKTPLTRQRLPILVGLAARGYMVTLVEYRGREYFNCWREAVSDVRSAVRYMRRHGKVYGGDSDRIVLMGESAGGHLGPVAAYSGDTFDDPEDDLSISAGVSGVITLFGPSDPAKLLRELVKEDAPANPAAPFMVETFMSVSRTDSTEQALERLPDMSVLRWIRPGADIPPTLIAQGDRDILVPVWSAEELYNKLTGNGFDAEYYLLHGARHGDMRFYGHEMTEIYSRFIDRVTALR